MQPLEHKGEDALKKSIKTIKLHSFLLLVMFIETISACFYFKSIWPFLIDIPVSALLIILNYLCYSAAKDLIIIEDKINSQKINQQILFSAYHEPKVDNNDDDNGDRA